MKNLFKLFSIITILMFIISSCEGPMGPAGANGKDGTNGTNGENGIDGKDVASLCLTCHNTANMDAKEAQYLMSDKAERHARSGMYCAKCHSTEGFQEVLNSGTFNTYYEVAGLNLGCTACHKHSTFEFSGDTVSQVLRTVAPVYTSWNNWNEAEGEYQRTNASDYGNLNNLCANCHQYRGARRGEYADTAAAHLTEGTPFNEVAYWPIENVGSNENDLVSFRAGTNFSLHEGANQPDYLIGKNGYEYTGVDYSAGKNWAHADFKCTECHFNTYNATTKTGGHTMKVNLSDPNCTGCHNLADKRTDNLALINTKLNELQALLVARKIFKGTSPLPSHDFYGTLLPNTASETYFALSYSNANTGDDYLQQIIWEKDAGFADRIGRQWKYGELGAAWNWTYVRSTASSGNRGVHNPVYAKKLLDASIAWLNAN